MADWRLASIAAAANRHAASNLRGWATHVAFLDDTVQAMLSCGWVHPWMNWAAEFMRSGREFNAPKLALPAHAVDRLTSVGFPNDEPGSEAEATSYCLHLLTGATVRSLARSGLLAFQGVERQAG